MKTKFLASVVLLVCVGCSTTPDEAMEPVPVHPFASGVTGPSGRDAADIPPPYEIAGFGGSARGSASPVIIDSRRFDPQVIDRKPWRGETKRPGEILPKHGRDKTLKAGKPNDLKSNGMTSRPRIDTKESSFFPAISQSPWTPPDPSIAVGMNHVLETVNMEIAWYDKDGTALFQQTLDSSGDPGFFEELGAGSFTFDPKCFYDTIRNRYVVLALEHYTGESWITIAVSDDGDPNGLWYKYRTWALPEIDETTYWVDYPGFGFDDRGWYVTNNLFRESGPGGGFGGTLLRSFDPTGALEGGDLEYVDLLITGGSHQVSQVPDGDAPALLARISNSTTLQLVHINDPLGEPEPSFAEVAIPVYNYPDDRPPTPGGTTLNSLDGRLMNVILRNGTLWTGHSVRTPEISNTVGRWYEVDLDGWPLEADVEPVIHQSGEIRPSPIAYTCFPAIAVNKEGHAAVVYTMSSVIDYPSLQVAGRVPGDPLGTLGSPNQLAISSAVPVGDNAYRWGDYFDAAVDPADDDVFWVVGQIYTPSGWLTDVSSFSIALIGDFNLDGIVDGADLTLLLAAWGTDDELVDLDGDGLVNGIDLTILLGNWD
jgi:hypothetical protein